MPQQFGRTFSQCRKISRCRGRQRRSPHSLPSATQHAAIRVVRPIGDRVRGSATATHSGSGEQIIEAIAELGVIDSGRFMRPKLVVGGVSRQVAIEIRRGTIDAEDAYLLQQRRKENVVHRA